MRKAKTENIRKGEATSVLKAYLYMECLFMGVMTKQYKINFKNTFGMYEKWEKKPYFYMDWKKRKRKQ